MENKKAPAIDRITGIVLFIGLMTAAIIGMTFHEPWFDEIQAYLIARDASLHDLFFSIPHYEGHPPLWHLLLLPAKLGLSCRTTLWIAQIVTYAGMLAMLELFSPFGWKMKLFLSSSYFLVYQYGVISRPYAMLMLAALLVAEIYPDRDKKTVRYLLAMLFMCLCHSYGIAIAGGLAATDLIRRFIQEKSIPGLIKSTGKKLLIAYGALLAAAMLIIIEISPQGNAYGMNDSHIIYFLVSLFLCWSMLPSETFLTSFINDNIKLQNAELSHYELLISYIFSVIVWYVLIRICKKRKILFEFITIYAFLSVLMALYSMPHHFGVFMIFTVMFLWIAQKKEPLSVSELTAPFEKSDNFRKIMKYVVRLITAIAVTINLYWNIHCFSTDYKEMYDVGSRTAEWIKENDLEDKKILAGWNMYTTKMLTYGSVSTNAYLDHNLFMNADRDLSYCTHVVTTDDEYDEDIKRLKSMGSPEVILTSSISIEDEVEALDLKDKYVLCYRKANVRTFKDTSVNVYTVIYVRKDLAGNVKKDAE
ncbi:MAG TPA: hypothetical protein P5191_15100 [Ruminococcus sp.]|nr:hypothetical protein [Ruminococcus sp.]